METTNTTKVHGIKVYEELCEMLASCRDDQHEGTPAWFAWSTLCEIAKELVYGGTQVELETLIDSASYLATILEDYDFESYDDSDHFALFVAQLQCATGVKLVK